MDRQELRLVFERGDVLLHGWVPTYARIHAIADEAATRGLCELFPGARVAALAAYAPKDRHCAGHGNQYDVYQEFELHWGEGQQKSRLYCELLRGFLTRSGDRGFAIAAIFEKRRNGTGESRSPWRAKPIAWRISVNQINCRSDND